MLLPACLSAQAAPAPAIGSRIRFTPGGGVPVVGELVEWKGDSIVLSGRDGQQAFELAGLSRLEAYAGRRRRVGRGVAIGLLAGTFLGATLGYASGDDEGGFFQFSAGDKALMAGVGGGLLGLAGGAIIGSVTFTDRWLPVDLPRTQVAPLSGGRLGVSFGLAF